MPGFFYEGNGFFDTSILNNSSVGNSKIISSVINSSNIDMGNLVITNHGLPTLQYDVANKLYVDTAITNAGVNGNFTVGQVLIGDTGGNIRGYPNFTYTSTVLKIDSTTQATDASSGALIVAGGASVIKDMYIQNVNMTPSIGDIFKEQSVLLANNVSIPTIIPGFSFNTTQVRYFNAIAYVTVNTGSELNAGYEIKGIALASGFSIRYDFIGDHTGVKFQITPSGQITYTSTNIPSYVSSMIKFRSLTLSP